MIRKALILSSLSLAFIGIEVEPAAAQVPPGLKRAEPLLCDSGGDFTLHRRYIETSGNGVEVRGNCDVVITESHIVAGGAAVLVAGNGDVRIENSTVEGSQAGLLIRGNGDIYYKNTVVKGGARVIGNGDLHDLGGNSVSGTASAPAAGRAPSSPTEIRGGKGSVVVDGDGSVTIKGSRDTLTVRDGDVTLTDGKTGAITARGGTGQVTLEGPGGSIVADGSGYVHLSSGGSNVTISSDWRNTSSRYSRSDTDRLIVELHATTEGGEIHFDLAGDVLFDSGKTALRPDAQAELAKVAFLLRQKAYGDVYVIGHTDSVGSDESNQKLSEGRAISVMRRLNEQERIPADIMKGRGMGEKQPISYNTLPNGADNPAGRAQNRRVEIKIGAKR